MTNAPDHELLAQFTKNHSEAAFTALVERHLGLVHSVALRHTRDPQHAQDIAQAVFIILARKAGSLGRGTVLPGWLYHTARLTAANVKRAEVRRFYREQAAYMQSTLTDAPPDPLWPELAPHLDTAMAQLRTVERDALVLRYFQNQNLAEVAAKLGLKERAAQKRVNRALEKLRKFLGRHGVALSLTALAGAVSANSVQAAPPALAHTISVVALAKGAAAGASTLTLAQGVLKIMAWTKLKTATVVTLVALVGTTVTTVIVVRQTHRPPMIATTTSNYPGDWIWEPNSRTLSRVPPIMLLRPSTLPAGWVPFNIYGHNQFLTRGRTVKELVAIAWSQKNSSLKIIFPAGLPEEKFDFIVTGQPHWWDVLKAELDQRFHLVEQIESRDNQDVVVVTTEKTI